MTVIYLASCKKPQRVIFASEIPKTAVGKLSRCQLRERLQNAATYA